MRNRNLRSNKLMMGCILIVSIFYSCYSNNLCQNEKNIECKFDDRKPHKDSSYTFIILLYNKKIILEDIKMYADSLLIKKKEIVGDYENAQSNPKRIEFSIDKPLVKDLKISYQGKCYKLSVKPMFDNYLIEYNFDKDTFVSIANNEEALTFE